MRKILFTVITLLVALTANASLASAAVEDYIAYWPLDEGEGSIAYGSGPSGTDGIFSGDIGWASGKSGRGVGFESEGGVIDLGHNIFDGTLGTLSMWVKFSNKDDENVFFSVRARDNSKHYLVFFIDRDGRLAVESRVSSSKEARVVGQQVLSTDEWYNVTIVAHGGGYTFYVNGEEEVLIGANNGRWFGDMVDRPQEYRIGMVEAKPEKGIFTGYFEGYIDELRVYDRALSASEVKDLYDKVNVETPLVPVSITPEVTLSASDAVVPYGSSVGLTWSSENVDTCSASGSWNGSRDTSGEVVMLLLASDSTYAITCVGEGGSVTKSIEVGVLPEEEATVDEEIAEPTPSTTQQPELIEEKDDDTPSTDALTMKEIEVQILELQKVVLELVKQLQVLLAQ